MTMAAQRRDDRRIQARVLELYDHRHALEQECIELRRENAELRAKAGEYDFLVSQLERRLPCDGECPCNET